MPNRSYVPDAASLDEGFPAALPVPELLRAFATWLAGEPRSSLGFFHLESAPLSAAYTGSDAAAELLRERLGIFLIFPDGARLALWQLPGRAPAVVRLGRERHVANVAPDLESYLLGLAREHVGLRAWLAARGVAEPWQAAPDPGSFELWFEAALGGAQPAAPLPAAALGEDFLERVDPLLGRLVDDPELLAFFERLGVDLRAVPGPSQLRALALPGSGAQLEIAWPWELPSEWLDAEFPKAGRREIERRRARMLWSVQIESSTFGGRLPLGIQHGEDLPALEARLGPPLLGSMGRRTWDFPQRRRSLTARINEGPAADPALPFAAVRALRWAYGQTL